jgi:hypothetical protein
MTTSPKALPVAALAGAESRDLQQYHEVSRLAVVAVIVGVLAASALAWPLLVVLSVVGVVLAGTALRSIAASQGALIGRTAALVGLSLSLLFGAWGLTRDVLYSQLLYAQARPLAENWLGLVCAGRLQEAHQLTKQEEQRQPADSSLEGYYASSTEAKEGLDMFFSGLVARGLIARGARAHVRFDGNVTIEDDRLGREYSHLITLRFAYDDETAGRPTTAKFTLTLVRRRPATAREARWSVRSIGSASAG